jgi:hypothetical protein
MIAPFGTVFSLSTKILFQKNEEAKRKLGLFIFRLKETALRPS